MYKKNIERVLFVSLCILSLGGISVQTAQAGWFGDHVCCNSGSAIGNGDGRAGANNQVGGSTGGSGSTGIGSYIAAVSNKPIPANAHYTGQQTVNGVTYDVWSYAGSGTATGPNLVSRVADHGGNGGSGSGSGTVVNPVPVDTQPLGDMVETLGHAYKGPNTSCDAIAGWSCDRDFLNNPVTIHMYVDDKFYTAFDTSIPYPGMIAPSWAPAYGPACGPSATAMWGFRYVTPRALKDGVSHSIKLYAINQGPRGNDLNTLLPNEGWSKGFAFRLQCSPPTLPIDLGAIIRSSGEQTEGVPFTISTAVVNIGRVATKAAFTLRVQIDKKSDTTATGWGYEGPGINGDVRVQTSIPSGIAANATTTHDFTGVLLPAGTYRMRALADPDFIVETTASRQLSNNTTNWTYFTVKPGVVAPDLSFNSFTISSKCAVDDMAVNDTCPSTKVSFTLKNSGSKTIVSGMAIPYYVEYLLPGEDATGVWHKSTTGTFSGGLGIGATSAAIEVAVPNLPTGSIMLRMVVNAAPGLASLGETNYSNNTSNASSLTYVPANADLSFQSFAVTSACDPVSMAGNAPCPATKVSLVLLNKGNKTITNGTTIPYTIEYQAEGTTVWKSAMTGTFTGGIAAKSSTAGVSPTIIASVPNLKMGTTQLRATVNPAPYAAALNEKNFTDNTSSIITQAYAYSVGTVELTHKNEVVRYGASTTLDWLVDADYKFTCKLLGTFAPGVAQTLTNTPGVQDVGVVRTAGLTSAQNFSLTCTPQAGPGIPSNVVTKTVTVEVVPSVQEI